MFTIYVGQASNLFTFHIQSYTKIVKEQMIEDRKKVLCYRVRECVWLLQALCLHAISFFTHISFSIKVSVMYSRNLRIDGQPFLMLLLSKVSTTLQRVENERSRRSHSSRLSSLIHNYFIPCIRLIEIFFHDL